MRHTVVCLPTSLSSYGSDNSDNVGCLHFFLFFSFFFFSSFFFFFFFFFDLANFESAVVERLRHLFSVSAD